jgi:hypothetical protein
MEGAEGPVDAAWEAMKEVQSFQAEQEKRESCCFLLVMCEEEEDGAGE